MVETTTDLVDTTNKELNRLTFDDIITESEVIPYIINISIIIAYG